MPVRVGYARKMRNPSHNVLLVNNPECLRKFRIVQALERGVSNTGLPKGIDLADIDFLALHLKRAEHSKGAAQAVTRHKDRPIRQAIPQLGEELHHHAPGCGKEAGMAFYNVPVRLGAQGPPHESRVRDPVSDPIGSAKGNDNGVVIVHHQDFSGTNLDAFPSVAFGAGPRAREGIGKAKTGAGSFGNG